jgi:hypothetical protein
MARSIAKRKYKNIRKQFKQEIKPMLMDNKSLCMALSLTYVAGKHRCFIHELWYFFSQNCTDDTWKKYCRSKHMGKMITGDENIYKTLYFCGYKDIANKYKYKLPEKIAWGEIHSLVLKIINN